MIDPEPLRERARRIVRARLRDRARVLVSQRPPVVPTVNVEPGSLNVRTVTASLSSETTTVEVESVVVNANLTPTIDVHCSPVVNVPPPPPVIVNLGQPMEVLAASVRTQGEMLRTNTEAVARLLQVISRLPAPVVNLPPPPPVLVNLGQPMELLAAEVRAQGAMLKANSEAVAELTRVLVSLPAPVVNVAAPPPAEVVVNVPAPVVPPLPPEAIRVVLPPRGRVGYRVETDSQGRKCAVPFDVSGKE